MTPIIFKLASMSDKNFNKNWETTWTSPWMIESVKLPDLHQELKTWQQCHSLERPDMLNKDSPRESHTKDSQLGFFQEARPFCQRNLLLSTFGTMRLIYPETSTIRPFTIPPEKCTFKCQSTRVWSKLMSKHKPDQMWEMNSKLHLELSSRKISIPLPIRFIRKMPSTHSTSSQPPSFQEVSQFCQKLQSQLIFMMVLMITSITLTIDQLTIQELTHMPKNTERDRLISNEVDVLSKCGWPDLQNMC